MEVTAISKLPKHTFQRFGRTYHLSIRTVEDLELIPDLEEALWIATTAPIETINCDLKFMNYMDFDRDGRIRVSEVKAAVRWLLDHHQHKEKIEAGNFSIVMDDIREDSPEGKRIRTSAAKILRRIARKSPSGEEKKVIELSEVQKIIAVEEKGGLDEAGIVLASAAPNEKICEFIKTILLTVGGKDHHNGETGVADEQLEQFMSQSKEFCDWYMLSDLPDGKTMSAIMPLGYDTGTAYTSFIKFRDKIDQYFALCDLVRLNPELLGSFRPAKEQIDTLNFSDTSAVDSFLAEQPLSWPKVENVLNFESQINPYYAEDIQEFSNLVLRPILGKNPKTLTEHQWRSVKNSLQKHHEWMQSRPEVDVDEIDPSDLKVFLDDPDYVNTLNALIQESHKKSFDLDNLRLVEKFILFQANILQFVNSFVSFPELYNPKKRALFEVGTLIIDGRHFTLAVKVPNRDQHAKFSSVSNMFVMYVEVFSDDSEKLYELAVPITSGTRGNVHVNKWGIFRDIHGVEHHARVVQIVENPISIGEAIAAPFKRLGQALTSKLEDMTNKAEQQLDKEGGEVLTKIKEVPDEKAKPSTEAPRKEADNSGGLLAGGGIAFAALGSSVAFIARTLSEIGWKMMLGGLLGAILAVMLPAVIVAYIKLVKRDLSSILEGSGWGLNSRMRLTRGQTFTFTHRPPYPVGSKGIVHRSWWFWILFLVLILVGIAYFWGYLPI